MINKKCTNTIKIILIITTIVTFSILIGLFFGALDIFFQFFQEQENQECANYTIVVNNDTKKTQENIKVAYSYGIEGELCDLSYIDTIKPFQYKKINIKTKELTKNINHPYDLWMVIEKNNVKIAEYIEKVDEVVGGFCVVKIEEKNGEINLRKLPVTSDIHRWIYERHLKNQNEVEWE